MHKYKRNLLLAVFGAMIGSINGFFGGGGGMLAVPVLTIIAGLSPKVSHATALAVILPVSVASGITYIVNGEFDLSVGIPATIGVVIGGIVGAIVLNKLRTSWLVKLFAFVMLAAGIKLIIG